MSLTDKVIERIRANIPYGSKVFWVCPTLEASSSTSSRRSSCVYSAMERYEELSTIFPGKVGLLHGRMDSEAKEKAIYDFQTCICSNIALHWSNKKTLCVVFFFVFDSFYFSYFFVI